MNREFHPAAPPVWRRTLLTAVLGGLGAVLFVPLMMAGAPPTESLGPAMWLIFPACVVAAVTLMAWLGYRWSDRLQLPMPILRPWELREPAERAAARTALLAAIGSGLVLAVLGLAAVKVLHVPPNPGSVAVRAASTLFAAVVTETAAHLFLLAGLLRFFGPRRLLFLVVSSLAFVLAFHGDGGDQSMFLAGALMVMNFLMALAMGAIFLRFGFEAAVLTHAFAHLALLTLS